MNAIPDKSPSLKARCAEIGSKCNRSASTIRQIIDGTIVGPAEVRAAIKAAGIALPDPPPAKRKPDRPVKRAPERKVERPHQQVEKRNTQSRKGQLARALGSW